MRTARYAGHAPGRRRSPHAALAVLAVTAAALLAPAAAPAAQAPLSAPFDDAGYWAFADRTQQRLDGSWDERRGQYRPGGGGTDSMVNSLMLLTHSVAAMHGHDGPSRNDHRARLVARALTSAPAFVTRRPRNARPGSQVHVPGWSNSMDGSSAQHLVYDGEIVDGLAAAWRARRQLDLPVSTADAIVRALDSTARGTFWRWPTIRLNQVNWYAAVYSAATTVTGRGDLVRHDMRLQLMRFVRGIRASGSSIGNLGPGMRFHYLPHSRLNHPMNVDSAEYANIVLSFTRYYEQARRAGMKPLPGAHTALLRQWVARVLAGYWTHGGYMNWDSGLGFDRWHQAKKLGLTQQALIGIAQAEAFQPSRAHGRWAKWMLDRGLAWHDRLGQRAGGLPDPVLFGVRVVPQSAASARLAAARMQANAARAVDAGLGRQAASRPPALYAFDPDIGRLAVTTPAYNTAIVAVNQRAFPYGGIELARLYDGDQDVAANIGGRPPAAFGVAVRDMAGRPVLASQVGRAAVTRGVTPLRLLKAPRGAGATASASVGRAFAGPFTDLRATGTVRGRTLQVRATHRFTRAWIETRWTVSRLRGRARYTADVLFPSTGPGARVVAVLRDGRRLSVAGAGAVRLSRVAYFHVISRHSGYVVVPRGRPGAAVARIKRPARQSSAPNPGPTLAIEVARRARFGRAGLVVRLATAGDADAAAAVARRLR
jgi:hypothetical protein